MNDPIVEEVRRIRDEYAKRFDYDLKAMVADLRQKEYAHREQIVSFPPKPPPPKQEARLKQRSLRSLIHLGTNARSPPSCPLRRGRRRYLARPKPMGGLSTRILFAGPCPLTHVPSPLSQIPR